LDRNITKNRSMKKVLSLAILAALVTSFWACDEANPVNFPPPAVTAPAAASVQVGTPVDVSFSYAADAGFASSSVTQTGGTATIKTDGTAGATSGTIVVTFTAGATAGAGSVTLTVTDVEGDDDDATAVLTLTPEPVEETEVTVTSNITASTTWEAGKTYILGGRITVVSGVTLEIEPGTVIKGQAGTGSNATCLLVARGGKLMAEGTAALPIIFTSVADEISPEDIAAGDFASPNLDPTANGLWGGLLILGKAKISVSAASGELAIEGIPTSDPNGLYGGTDDADNSGVIKYISIRHGGSLLGGANEINGLTLGGVGSETVIENVEVVGNQDDGIEWFGGTVSVKNIVIWNAGDDGLDTDMAWSGTAENYVIITSSGHSFELDGPEGTYGTTGTPAVTTIFHTFKNGTVVATSATVAGENLINTDANSGVKFDGLFITGLGDANANSIINRVSSSTGIIEYADVIIDVPAGRALADFFVAGATIPAGITAAATATKKADVAVLSWTWASQAEMLTGL
jgi:predicted small lipoprotein YifL